MGKKLDALLGRGFKTTKFKSMVNLANSRLAVLKNQHQARYSVARSDVIQILNLGHHERALLRVEQVIKEQNMLDVLVMIENYCYLLIERVNLLEHAKECPEELKEAISSMIYTATRCGEFPELQELRAVFTSRFGKEFVARSVELRNNCGVNPKMIQKLSTRMPSMENRVKVLKEIAVENNIALQIEEVDSVTTEVKTDAEKKEEQVKANQSNDSEPIVPENVGMIDGFSNSMQTRRKYKDVADAAQAAFESAAYAAEAARAAVELSSRSDSHDSDDPRNPSLQPRNIAVSPKHIESELQSSEAKDSRGIEIGSGHEKVHPIQKYSSESEEDEIRTKYKQTKNKLEEFEQREKEAEYNRSFSTSSLDSLDNTWNEEGPMRSQGIGITFDETDDETAKASRVQLPGSNVRDSMKNYTLHTNEVLSFGKVRKDYVAEEGEMKACNSPDKAFPMKSQASSSTEPWPKNSEANPAKEYNDEQKDDHHRLCINKTPVSVRTRRTYRR